jgi:hypothetical protein
MDVLLGYVNTRPIDKELVRLLTGESHVLRAQLAESAPCTKPAQAPARVRARRDDHPRRGRKPFRRVGERSQTPFRVYTVEIVENDDGAAVVPGETVQQLVDRRLDVRPRELQPGQGGSGQPGAQTIDGMRDVRPEL